VEKWWKNDGKMVDKYMGKEMWKDNYWLSVVTGTMEF